MASPVQESESLNIQFFVDSMLAMVHTASPGGHHFNRTDTKMAKESRKEVYQFLAGYLHPSGK